MERNDPSGILKVPYLAHNYVVQLEGSRYTI